MYPYYPPSLLSFPVAKTRLIGRGGKSVGELIGWSRGDAKRQGLRIWTFFCDQFSLWEFEGFTLEDHPNYTPKV